MKPGTGSWEPRRGPRGARRGRQFTVGVRHSTGFPAGNVSFCVVSRAECLKRICDLSNFITIFYIAHRLGHFQIPVQKPRPPQFRSFPQTSSPAETAIRLD